MKTNTTNTIIAIDHQRIMNETFIQNAAQFGSIRASYLPLSELFIDDSYQRKPQRQIHKIASNWDPDKCGFLEVSYRKDVGKFAIIDGQNRYYAALEKGIDRLPCHILMDIKVTEEAKRFATQDENKTIVNSYDKFKAELRAGNPTSMKIKEICDRYNILIKYGAPSQTGRLRSITSTRDVLSSIGEEGLCWIFDVIKESGWHNQPGAYSAAMMRALQSVYINTESDDYGAAKRNLVRYFNQTTPERTVAQSLMCFIGGKTATLTRFLMKVAEQGLSNVKLIGD